MTSAGGEGRGGGGLLACVKTSPTTERAERSMEALETEESPQES